jgi:hypothetical protein
MVYTKNKPNMVKGYQRPGAYKKIAVQDEAFLVTCPKCMHRWAIKTAKPIKSITERQDAEGNIYCAHRGIIFDRSERFPCKLGVTDGSCDGCKYAFIRDTSGKSDKPKDEKNLSRFNDIM